MFAAFVFLMILVLKVNAEATYCFCFAETSQTPRFNFEFRVASCDDCNDATCSNQTMVAAARSRSIGDWVTSGFSCASKPLPFNGIYALRTDASNCIDQCW